MLTSYSQKPSWGEFFLPSTVSRGKLDKAREHFEEMIKHALKRNHCAAKSWLERRKLKGFEGTDANKPASTTGVSNTES